jgi:hypothetical protein
MTKRRKQTRPARRARTRKLRFRLTVEGQEMVVDYQPHWMKDTGHFEFRSPHNPPRRIPVSETGYRSHFGGMDEIEAADSPQDYARMVVLGQLRGASKAQRDTAEDQLSLF